MATVLESGGALAHRLAVGRVLVVAGVLTAGFGGLGAPSPETAPESSRAWQRWEHALTSSRKYQNPYADVTLRVTFSGPNRRRFRTYGFWDGGDTFRVRCAFPAEGLWSWQTDCSDGANAGLHRQRGTVTVARSRPHNALNYRGFLKLSDNRRYLCYADGVPFLWLGDTAWAVPQRTSDEEWEKYIADRAEKHFTVIQVAPAPRWAGECDRSGERPFTDNSCAQWNPAYWQSFERKMQRANEQGLVIMLVGLMEPVSRYPEASQACLFARHIVARLYGNFVVFSASFDSEFMDLANQVGRAIREATSVHLITQHPGTPWDQPVPTFSLKYYDESYLDVAGVQTGHNGGNLEWTARNAIDWNLSLYRHEPHKPVINLEAMYDARGEKAWRAVDARSTAWRTWLSGAAGYTYGAGETADHCPGSNGGVWMWVTDPQKPDYWEKALQWESAFQMQYLYDFLAALEWWRLRPAHQLIRNQPADVTRRMVLAQSNAGDLAVAYLPANDAIELDMSGFVASLEASWFNPAHGGPMVSAGTVENQGTHRFIPPAAGDWVLLLRRPTKS